MAPDSSDTNQLDHPALREYLWHVHQYVSESIRFADGKAGFCMAVSGGMLGALASNHDQRMGHSPMDLEGVCWIASCGLLTASFLAAVAVVFPRLRSHQPKGFIFWRGISEYESQEVFSVSVLQVDKRELTEHLAQNLFAISLVATAKYRCIRTSIVLGCLGGFMAAFLLANPSTKSASASVTGVPRRPLGPAPETASLRATHTVSGTTRGSDPDPATQPPTKQVGAHRP